MSSTYWSSIEMSDLIGLTLVSAEQSSTNYGDEAVLFATEDGRQFSLHHSQSCCESVTIEDICGDLADLVGSPILQSELVTNSDDPVPENHDYTPESYTWTFIKLATNKGSVTIRFFGSSNGYYGETASLHEQKSFN